MPAISKENQAALTQERLHELFDYDPETGVLTNRVMRNSRAGCLNTRTGYRHIKIDGREYKEHRIVWCWVKGAWPKEQIDHVNGIRSDNRISNLRPATHTENCRNQKLKRNNSSGHTGVCWHRRDEKWHARISINGKFKHIGYFDEFSDAVAARKAAEIQYGFHPNHGLTQEQRAAASERKTACLVSQASRSPNRRFIPNMPEDTHGTN